MGRIGRMNYYVILNKFHFYPSYPTYPDKISSECYLILHLFDGTEIGECFTVDFGPETG
jgi:hypothetical protein